MSLFTRKIVTSKVGDGLVQFKELSIGDVYRLKSVLAPVGRMIVDLFGRKMQDNAVMSERTIDKESGIPVETQHIAAIDITLAKFRVERQDKQFNELMEAVLGDSNKLTIGRIMVRSMESQFDHPLTDKEVIEFMDGLSLSIVKDIFEGIVRANEASFGPLGKWARMLRQQMLAQVMPESAPEASVESAAPQPEPKDPTE